MAVNFMSIRRRYMMATAATSGGTRPADISRDVPDLCVIEGEQGDDYIGRWVEGLGFTGVRFPKATTRELTDEEIARYDGMRLAINGTLLPGSLQVAHD